MANIIDFRNPPKDPFMIPLPYGPASPWPKDRPKMLIPIPYGPSAATSVTPDADATFVIAPYGQTITSEKASYPEKYYQAPDPRLGGWWGNQYEALKTYSVTHPWVIVAFWGGMVLLGMRAMSVMKS